MGSWSATLALATASARSTRFLLVSVVILATSGCVLGSAVSLLSGGGGPLGVQTNVVGTQAAKNATQAVQTNQQTIEAGDNSTIRVEELDKPVETRDVEELTINNTEVPLMYILLLIAGWLAPSPSEISRGIRSMFSTLVTRKRAKEDAAD